jgi:hypothetical protein
MIHDIDPGIHAAFCCEMVQGYLETRYSDETPIVVLCSYVHKGELRCMNRTGSVLLVDAETTTKARKCFCGAATSQTCKECKND